MALNNFTDSEAIDRCIALRDRLPFDDELNLVPRWADKDALAQVINLADDHSKLVDKNTKLTYNILELKKQLLIADEALRLAASQISDDICPGDLKYAAMQKLQNDAAKLSRKENK